VEGSFVFVDSPRPGADPSALARALALDAYRARALAMTSAPFLARGFSTADAAARAATALDAGGFPASAHAGDALDALPAADEAHSFTADANGLVFLLANGKRFAVDAGAIRAIVSGKLSIRIETDERTPVAVTFGTRGGLIGAVAAMSVEASRTERTLTQLRLELFLEAPEGPRRIGVLHDRFDFAQLREKKTLSAVRNIEILREAFARAASGVAVDDAFARSEMSRGPLAPDMWADYDLARGGTTRQVPARSNRSAFDVYARARFLHEISRRRVRQDHYYEL